MSTAIVAVIFAGALTNAADARSHSRVHPLNSAAAQAGSTTVEPGAALAPQSPEAAVEPYAISPATREKLSRLEIASMMPQNGDLAMWNVPSSKSTHVAKVAAHAKKGDQLRRFASGIISRTSSIAMSLTRSAMRFIGTPYVFGGTSPSGFDCSGYTQHVFAMLGISLPRTADAQFYAGHPTIGGLRTGDLVFFQTYEPGPSHVGIYVGNGHFIHSSSHGVMISPLGQSYWASRYLGAKRVAALR